MASNDRNDQFDNLTVTTGVTLPANSIGTGSLDTSIAPTWTGSHRFTNATDVFYLENDLNALGYPGHGFTSTDTSGTYNDVRWHRFNDVAFQVTDTTAGNLAFKVNTGGRLQFEGNLFGSGDKLYENGNNRLISPSGPLSVSPKSAAPSGAQNGDIQYADGVGWNPGSGAGFYGYEEGVWVKL